ncbi:MAG: crossover junction endodeoxyribonuclease RuvC [Planctomycetes bacterium]|nr:crossover junction endodeoxyribonuclease RuvC [Planctomycetota bacterium]
MRVLGIDPGLQITGFACVEGAGGDEPQLIEAGVFRLGGGGGESISGRLVELEGDMRELLDRTSPDLVAVEGLFAHYKHPATAIAMGHARGVILLAVHRAGVRLVEYKPNEIKKAVTGYGHASKEQIQLAVKELYRLAELPTPPDMADAIAIATCAVWREEIGSATFGSGSDAETEPSAPAGGHDARAGHERRGPPAGAEGSV